jgi:muconolactone delta-isomerase
MLFLVVSTPRPERPSELASTRQSFWPWIARYQAEGVCKQIYARVGRGAVAIFNVTGNDVLHRILNEWADIIPAHFDTYPLVDAEATRALLAAQVAAQT